jgi:hypothetical protein
MNNKNLLFKSFKRYIMFQLKTITKESIPVALEKAERYRLLNEPWLAESICSDILEVDPQNTKAIIISLLAVTDQFETSDDITKARQLLSRLPGEYEKHYYEGIICERQGKAILTRNRSHGFIAYDWLSDAMEHYEKAETVRPTGNDDSILRWNTCARMIMHHHLQPKTEEYVEPPLE